MYAIVDVKDKQFKVRENDTLYVPYHSDAEVDETLTLDRVLLLSNGEGDVTIGTPTVDGATVTATVVDHVKGDKVIVFKKKRRKRYRVKRGHRQQYTQIRIDALNANGAAPAPAEDATDEADEAPHDEPATAEAATEEAVTEETETEDAATEDTATEEAATGEADAPDAEAAEADAEVTEAEEADAEEAEASADEDTTDDAPEDEADEDGDEADDKK